MVTMYKRIHTVTKCKRSHTMTTYLRKSQKNTWKQVLIIYKKITAKNLARKIIKLMIVMKNGSITTKDNIILYRSHYEIRTHNHIIYEYTESVQKKCDVKVVVQQVREIAMSKYAKRTSNTAIKILQFARGCWNTSYGISSITNVMHIYNILHVCTTQEE